MTLTEYKNQAVPVRRPTVILKDGEYLTGTTTRSGGDTLTQIWVNGFPYQYVLKNRAGCLYTTDSDGNPVAPSVFEIRNK